MSGYTQMSENKIMKPLRKKWYEDLTPEQLASDFKDEYKPNRLMKSILNWYEWYKGSMYIANGNVLKSKDRQPTDEERKNAILRSIELKNNLIDVEKYFNQNKINLFNFNTFKRNDNQEIKKRNDDLKDLLSILNSGKGSDSEEQHHSSENSQVCNVQETLNKHLSEMEEENKSSSSECSFEHNIDLHKTVDMDKKPLFKGKKQDRVKPLSFDKEYCNKEKKPKAVVSKKTVPMIKTPYLAY